MSATKDYGRFSARAYLNEYYDETDEDYEGGFLLKSFHDIYSAGGERERLLEVGGGPTVYQLISASSKVREIFFSEYTDENLDEVRKWVNADPDAFNWDDFFKVVLKYEGKEITKETIAAIKGRVRGRIKTIAKCDIYNKNPLEPLRPAPFDVVSVNFCPESVVDNQADFERVMSNIFSLLKEGGLLVMSLLRNARYYKVGEVKFSSFAVNEGYLKNFLAQQGLSDIVIHSIPVDYSGFGEGFDGLIALSAIKPQ